MITRKRIFNQTFSLGPDGFTHLNACVGNNGFVDSLTYANGFSRASQLLIDAVIADNLNIFVDDIVYPICFNARHHIELFLKWSIPEIAAIRGLNSTLVLSKTHDLEKLFVEYSRLCSDTDSRLQIFAEKMSECITDFYQIDPTGETFRYPNNQENARHLENTPIISIVVFRDRYLNLCAQIEEFVEVLSLLKSEYRTGTFTSKLSRKAIEEIAHFLPQHNDWGKPDFVQYKDAIKEKYSLTSNKDIDKAIKKIRTNRELSALIGLEILLPELTQDTFSKLQLIVDEKMNVDALKKEEWTTIYCLYEISNYQYYSEDFDFLYLNTIQDFVDQREVDSLIYKILMNREKVILGLKKLGQKTFLSNFIDNTNFDIAKKKREERNHFFTKKMNRSNSIISNVNNEGS